MHPAYSVIFFTTASGAGYGLLALLGVFGATGLLPQDRWFGLAGLGLALGTITFGLLASTFHLGHPERAIRAFSQWRSSWLSREGVLAVATYAPAGLYGVYWVFYQEPVAWLGALSALFAAATVACTGMIYASLKPIRAWCNAFTVPTYLMLALATGALWLQVLLHLFGTPHPQIALLSLIAVAAGFWLKRRAWRLMDTTSAPSTPESATGLGGLGRVRLLEPPNVVENYVQREMGYRIARKHGAKLRAIVVVALFAVPFLATAFALPAGPLVGIALTIAAALSASLGVVVERWLFFAEARHTVMLYYGAEAA